MNNIGKTIIFCLSVMLFFSCKENTVQRLASSEGQTLNLPYSKMALTAKCLFLKYPFENFFCELRFVYLEIEVSVDGGNFRNHLVGRDICPEFLRDRRGTFAENFSEFEAGKRIVPHFRRGRKGEAIVNLLCRNAVDFEFLRNILLVIHVF